MESEIDSALMGFDEVDLVTEFRPSIHNTEVICHAQACSWRQVLPSRLAPHVARLHAMTVHRKYMLDIRADRLKAESDRAREAKEARDIAEGRAPDTGGSP